MSFSKILSRICIKTPVYILRDQTKSSVFKTCKMGMATQITSVLPVSKEKDIFRDTLPSIIDTITDSNKFTELPEIGTWLKKVLEYNLVGGKMNRGLSTVFAYKMLEKPDKLTEESEHLARVMGWCVEMLQAYLIVLDDILDGSTTRRGAACWYRVTGVGLGAINDAILIHTSMLQLVKTHAKGKPYYDDILDLFNEVLLNTSMGQQLDFTMAHRSTKDYSMFTIDKYNAIVKYKTSFYTYKLPVSLGLYLTNNSDEEVHRKAEEVCLDIGRTFQIQDDYIDAYSDESLSGKVGTDIQEGKCSWLAVTALQRCSPAQRIVFESCYASDEPAHIERIKQLYNQLDIPTAYKEEQQRCYDSIIDKIKHLPDSLPPALFKKLLDMIHNRNV